MTIVYVDVAAAASGDGSILAPYGAIGDVNFGLLSPGDEVWVTPGTYIENDISLSGCNGNAQNPIRIIKNPLISGRVIMTSGRTATLPDSDYAPVVFSDDIPSTSRERAFWFENCSWIIFGSEDWTLNSGAIDCDFVIHGYYHDGLRFEGDASNCTIQYCEIYNNGNAFRALSNTVWRTDGRGIRAAGANNTVQYCNIYDNGQDIIQIRQNPASLSNFRMYRVWAHNRQHVDPANPQRPWNFEAHSDGLQFFQQASIDGTIVEECLLGPGLTNSLLLGDSGSNAINTQILRNCLLYPTDNGISANSQSQPDGWTVNSNTIVSHTQDSGGFNMFLYANVAEGNLVSNSNLWIEAGPDGMTTNIAGSNVSSSQNVFDPVEPAWQDNSLIGQVFDTGADTTATDNFDVSRNFMPTSWPVGFAQPGAPFSNPTQFFNYIEAQQTPITYESETAVVTDPAFDGLVTYVEARAAEGVVVADPVLIIKQNFITPLVAEGVVVTDPAFAGLATLMESFAAEGVVVTDVSFDGLVAYVETRAAEGVVVADPALIIKQTFITPLVIEGVVVTDPDFDGLINLQESLAAEGVVVTDPAFDGLVTYVEARPAEGAVVTDSALAVSKTQIEARPAEGIVVIDPDFIAERISITAPAAEGIVVIDPVFEARIDYVFIYLAEGAVVGLGHLIPDSNEPPVVVVHYDRFLGELTYGIF